MREPAFRHLGRIYEKLIKRIAYLLRNIIASEKENVTDYTLGQRTNTGIVWRKMEDMLTLPKGSLEGE